MDKAREIITLVVLLGDELEIGIIRDSVQSTELPG